MQLAPKRASKQRANILICPNLQRSQVLLSQAVTSCMHWSVTIYNIVEDETHIQRRVNRIKSKNIPFNSKLQVQACRAIWTFAATAPTVGISTEQHRHKQQRTVLSHIRGFTLRSQTSAHFHITADDSARLRRPLLCQGGILS